MTRALITPSQTVGPFFHDALLRPGATRHTLRTPSSPGEHIRIEGRVTDADDAAVFDAIVEVWQADHEGRYATSAFPGFGRSETNESGGYWFDTVKPGAVPFDAARVQAPHINVIVLARGLLNHLFTRIYFADGPLGDDPVLSRVPDARRSTLVASARVRDGARVYTFDIALGGPRETVFFDFIAPDAPRTRAGRGL